MQKTTTVTLKMHTDVKEELYNFCDMQGLKINRFIEKAVEEKIEKELIKQSAGIFANYKEEAKTAVDHKTAAKVLGWNK